MRIFAGKLNIILSTRQSETFYVRVIFLLNSRFIPNFITRYFVDRLKSDTKTCAIRKSARYRTPIRRIVYGRPFFR